MFLLFKIEKKKLNILLRFNALILVFFLPSCEGGTTFTKNIENKSFETITVKIFAASITNLTVTLNPNETKQVFWDDQMGKFTDGSYTCTLFIDSFNVSITNGKTLIKDIMNPNNWFRESKGGRNSKENCTFIITNSDLQ